MNTQEYVNFVKQNRNSLFCPNCQQWLVKDKYYFENGYYENQKPCCVTEATEVSAWYELVWMSLQVR